MTFSDQLKQYRKQLSLNQAELAQFLEVSPRSIWKWENGELPHILTQEAALNRLNNYDNRLTHPPTSQSTR